MNQRGFSLIELIVVTSVATILLALATINFHNWIVKANIEKQMKEVYTDLSSMRQRAMVTGMSCDLQFPSAKSVSFRCYSSEGDIAGNEMLRRALPYSVTVSNSNPIVFNQRGMLEDLLGKNICVFSDENPSVDSLVITRSRISMGKIISQGSKDAAACNKSNIELK